MEPLPLLINPDFEKVAVGGLLGFAGRMVAPVTSGVSKLWGKVAPAAGKATAGLVDDVTGAAPKIGFRPPPPRPTPTPPPTRLPLGAKPGAGAAAAADDAAGAAPPFWFDDAAGRVGQGLWQGTAWPRFLGGKLLQGAAGGLGGGAMQQGLTGYQPMPLPGEGATWADYAHYYAPRVGGALLSMAAPHLSGRLAPFAQRVVQPALNVAATGAGIEGLATGNWDYTPVAGRVGLGSTIPLGMLSGGQAAANIANVVGSGAGLLAALGPNAANTASAFVDRLKRQMVPKEFAALQEAVGDMSPEEVKQMVDNMQWANKGISTVRETADSMGLTPDSIGQFAKSLQNPLGALAGAFGFDPQVLGNLPPQLQYGLLLSLLGPLTGSSMASIPGVALGAYGLYNMYQNGALNQWLGPQGPQQAVDQTQQPQADANAPAADSTVSPAEATPATAWRPPPAAGVV